MEVLNSVAHIVGDVWIEEQERGCPSAIAFVEFRKYTSYPRTLSSSDVRNPER